MKYLLLFALLSSPLAFAESEQKRAFDVDKDGIDDRFEYKRKGHVVRIEEDRNNDKKIDFITHYDNKEFFRVELQDENFDGKFDRKTSYKLLEQNGKTQIITEVDKDGDGKFEIKYTNVTNLDQKQENCEAEVQDTITELTKVTFKAVSSSQKGMIPTGLGYKVDHGCYTKWGYDFNKVIKETSLKGLQCLQNLDKKNRTGKEQTTAIRNAFNISKLYEGDKISLVCSETGDDYNWTGTAAHASSDAKSEPLKFNGVKHPYVSLNPVYPESKPGSDRDAENKYIQGIIFHETLHNLGYLHDESIEFPYACQTCCFEEGNEEEMQDVACRICTGNYKNATDQRYVRDVISLAGWRNQEFLGIGPSVKFAKENPKTTSAITLVAMAHANGNNPIGSALAGLIEEKNLPFVNTEDAIQVSILKSVTKTGSTDAVRSTKVMAQALFDLYYSKNGEATTKTLFDNRWLIKSQIKALEDSGDESKKAVGASMRNTLDKVITDMWLNEYPNQATSDKAYELYDYFNPKK